MNPSTNEFILFLEAVLLKKGNANISVSTVHVSTRIVLLKKKKVIVPFASLNLEGFKPF